MVGKVLGAFGCSIGIIGTSLAGNNLANAHEKTDITPVTTQLGYINNEINEINEKLKIIDIDSDYTNKDIAIIAKELRDRISKLETKKARRKKER